VTVHDCWRDVAIALMSSLADAGADPLDPAVVAYNHARNDRTVDASVWAAHAIAGAGSHANDVDYPAPGPEARIRPVEGAPGVIPPRLIVDDQHPCGKRPVRRLAPSGTPAQVWVEHQRVVEMLDAHHQLTTGCCHVCGFERPTVRPRWRRRGTR